MKYIIVMEQEEEGCDYTIGCGIDYTVVDLEDIAEAREYAQTLWRNTDGSDRTVDTIIIGQLYEKCDVEEWRAESEAEKQALKDRRKEAEERALLASLKAKYEGES